MAMYAWQIWGVWTLLAGGPVATQPPATEVNGRVTPAITQEFFEPAPSPRVLPAQILTPEAPPNVPTAGRGAPLVRPAAGAEVMGGNRWKARLALEVAEMHSRACDVTEARRWYQEVIKLAPTSEFAATAAERLNPAEVIPAGAQSREPPLADAQDANDTDLIH